jgi:hypothetical protein
MIEWKRRRIPYDHLFQNASLPKSEPEKTDSVTIRKKKPFFSN